MSDDPVMDAILHAVTTGREGETETARKQLFEVWTGLGVLGDPLHRCTLAHYLADLYADAAEALTWDIRALDAADAVTEERVQQHHASMHIAGFYPSLHLNLADDYRRLGSFDAAHRHLEAGRRHLDDLPTDPYGDTIRTAFDEVGACVASRDCHPRESAPGPRG